MDLEFGKILLKDFFQILFYYWKVIHNDRNNIIYIKLESLIQN